MSMNVGLYRCLTASKYAHYQMRMQYLCNLYRVISLAMVPHPGQSYYCMHVTHPLCDSVIALAMARDRLRCRLAAPDKNAVPRQREEANPILDCRLLSIVLFSLDTEEEIHLEVGKYDQKVLSSEHLEMMWTPGPY